MKQGVQNPFAFKASAPKPLDDDVKTKMAQAMVPIEPATIRYQRTDCPICGGREPDCPWLGGRR